MLAPYFYRLIGTGWVMWAIKHQPTLLSHDLYLALWLNWVNLLLLFKVHPDVKSKPQPLDRQASMLVTVLAYLPTFMWFKATMMLKLFFSCCPSSQTGAQPIKQATPSILVHDWLDVTPTVSYRTK